MRQSDGKLGYRSRLKEAAVADEQDQDGQPAADTGVVVGRMPPAQATAVPSPIATQPSGDPAGRTALPATEMGEQRPRAEQALDPYIELLPQPEPTAAGEATKARANSLPSGPDPDRVQALVKARVARIDRRRAKAGLARSGWNGRHYKFTASIQATHLARGKTLFARYQRETGVIVAAEDTDPLKFVRWTQSLKLALKASSWRAYRLGARAFIKTLPHEAMLEAVDMLDGDVGARANELRAPQPGRQQVGHDRPGWAKRVNKADFDAVLDSLSTFSRSKMGPCLKDWMLAGIHTGLQPSEWPTAVLDTRPDPSQPRGQRVWLHVVNAKAVHATHRMLDISGFSDANLDAVRQMIAWASKWSLAKEFDRRRSQCTQLLGEAFAAMFPRQQQRCSLDTLHHQFVHNMQTKYARAEVAALVGFLSNETVVDYGKRRLAWPDEEIREIPVPMAAQVTRMRERLELYEQRHKVWLMRQALKERRRRQKVVAVVEPGPDADPAN